MTAVIAAPVDVAVIVVGLNAKNFVEGCFASLQAADWGGYTGQLIYVDNGSTDGTPDMVRKRFPDVELLVNDSNLGFCPAANAGARLARSRNLLFLNDDTEIVGSALGTMIGFMDAHPDVATAGARLVFGDGREQWSGRRFPSFAAGIFGRRAWISGVFPRLQTVRAYLCKDEVARGEPFDVDWVSAAGQIFRTDAFWSVGGFAEDYYYWHEAVQGHRIKQGGSRVMLIPSARIVHHEGQGSGPRPYHRMRFHILDFHRGAFRAYREYSALAPWQPRLWVAGASLAVRAGVLLAYWRGRTLLQAVSARRANRSIEA